MPDITLIQQHVDAIQGAFLNAHAALADIQDEGLRDEARRALNTAHDVSDGSFHRLKRLCPASAGDLTLRSGGGK